ncbi:hypothetical protein AcV5_009385 [Taiwanofungus camphoratus]|nr:hypothetical protein AcV5_009385 [Antrodia cinnamomea]
MAKKSIMSNPPKQQAPSMSPSHTNTVGAVTGANLLSPEDDDDDICPVCESECTCQNRVNPTQSGRDSALVPSAPSISISNASATSASPAQTTGLQTLKIKFTLPSNLKFRKQPNADHQVHNANITQNGVRLDVSSPEATQSLASSVPTGINSMPQHLALGILDPTAPKRRGRPSKAVVAAREAAKAALAEAQPASGGDTGQSHDAAQLPSGHVGKSVTPLRTLVNAKQAANYDVTKQKPAPAKNAQKSKDRITTVRKGGSTKNLVKNAVAHLPLADFSDDAHSDRFPTFVSAASTSTHSSSSESSESELELSSLDSEIEAEEINFLIRGDRAKTLTRQQLANEGEPGRYDHASTNNWEIRPRKKSVGLEGDADSDSGNTSDDEDGLSEDSDKDDEEDMEADTEGDGPVKSEFDETSSRFGVSFGGDRTGWSDDEESSFDADLFFANLDGSSDSDSSSAELHGDEDGDSISDMDLSASLSADEEDALLLMDVDPSVQVRRRDGEYEFGLELDGLSFGWDQALFASNRPRDIFDVDFDLRTMNADIEMRAAREECSSDTEDQSATMDEMLLEESDGETTEDELVDSNGLPNPRAMMLFRWPSTVSAINPLSTMSPPPPPALPNASESVRIALASFPAHQSSPLPTPADILAGKISMDDLEDIEMDKGATTPYVVNQRSRGGVPAMGEFVTSPQTMQGSAVIDGKGASIPSPFPRTKVPNKRHRPTTEQSSNGSTSAAELPSDSVQSASLQSSDETLTQSQKQPSEMSPTDAIDLDDVLDSSFLDSSPVHRDHDVQEQEQAVATPTGTHIRSLSRWDRIPMAAFRRTREAAIGTNIEGSASDTGLSVYGGMSAMIGSPMFVHSKSNDKKSGSAKKRSKVKGPNSVIISPVLIPTRDGDRTPTSSSPHHMQGRSKREVRREKAMMKRKMLAKPAQHRHQQQYRPHHHHPNHKSRASSSMQRSGHFGSTSPSFGL